jgi:hypothetical protein
MKVATGTLAACLGIFVAFLVQMALPPVHVLHGARFVLVPMIFCYAAMSLPFPAMLGLAVFTGFLSDLMYLHVVGGRVEIALGCSIVFFVIVGSIANGCREFFLRGQWWPLIPVTVLSTCAFLLMQFIMISVRREGFVFEMAVIWRILAPGLLAGLFVPLLHAVVRPFAAMLPESRWEVRDY